MIRRYSISIIILKYIYLIYHRTYVQILRFVNFGNTFVVLRTFEGTKVTFTQGTPTKVRFGTRVSFILHHITNQGNKHHLRRLSYDSAIYEGFMMIIYWILLVFWISTRLGTP